MLNLPYEDKFSNELNNTLSSIMENIINEMPVKEISPDVFVIYALGNQDTMMYKALNGLLTSIRIDEIHSKVFSDISSDIYTAIRPNMQIPFSDSFKDILKKAETQRTILNCKYITSDHILLAILGDQNSTSIKTVLGSDGLTYELYYNECIKLHKLLNEIQEMDAEPIPEADTSAEQAVDSLFGKKKRGKGIQFCKNLNGLASIGKLDPIIDRDDIILKMEKIFARKRYNNVMLVGESGVGKTAIVEGLAYMINNRTAPYSLLNKTIYSLKIGEIIAGTSLMGMFEERINTIFNEIKKQKNCILFIDDAQALLDGGKKDNENLIPIISEYISSGDMQIIMACNEDGYRKMLMTNSTVRRCFQKIVVEQPTIDTTISILNGIKYQYEEFHNVVYPNGIVELIAKLSDRYITDVALPASAIGIMDEVGASKMLKVTTPQELTDKIAELSNLEAMKDRFIKMDNIDAANSIDQKIWLVKCDIKEISERKHPVDDRTITQDDVYAAVSQHTDIPVSRVSKDEMEVLSGIYDKLKENVIGQDESLELISHAIKRNKLGIAKRSKPMYSVFFGGPSGVGKTLTAKTLATEIFGDEKYLVRFDMSEYSDKTAVNKLIGTGAGYIGYDKGGLLTEAIKNRKYAVLLFDEIEKADTEIYNIMLQILDEGFLTDNMGNKVDFKNTIIIMTSNIGAQRAALEKTIGFGNAVPKKKKDIMKSELKKKFPPEFINRLDDVIFFNELTDEDMDSIIKLELNKFVKKMREGNYDVTYDKNTVDFIFNKTLDDREYGARPITRIIEGMIENKIVDAIIDSGGKTTKFEISASEDEILLNEGQNNE